MISDAALADWKTAIAHELEHQGFSQREIRMFIAGGAIFGHLRPDGIPWIIQHAFDCRLRPATAIDQSIEAAGHYNPTPNQLS